MGFRSSHLHLHNVQSAASIIRCLRTRCSSRPAPPTPFHMLGGTGLAPVLPWPWLPHRTRRAVGSEALPAPPPHFHMLGGTGLAPAVPGYLAPPPHTPCRGFGAPIYTRQLRCTSPCIGNQFPYTHIVLVCVWGAPLPPCSRRSTSRRSLVQWQTHNASSVLPSQYGSPSAYVMRWSKPHRQSESGSPYSTSR